MSELDDKLSEVARQYDDVQAELSRPEVSADPSEIRRLGKEAFAAVRGLRSPRRLGLLSGGSLATELIFALALGTFARSPLPSSVPGQRLRSRPRPRPSATHRSP